MYSTLISCLQIGIALSKGALLHYFAGSFLDDRFYPGKRTGIITVLLYGVLMLGIDALFSPAYEEYRMIGKLVFSLVVVFLITLCCYRAEFSHRLFVTITFLAVSENCFFIAYMVLQLGRYLTDFWLFLLEDGFLDSTDTFLNAVELTLTVLLLLMYALFLLLTYLCLRRIVISFREKEYSMQKKELLFLLSPGMVGLLLCVLLRMIMITVEEGSPQLLYDRYPPLMVLVPAVMVLSLVSIMNSVKLFQDMICLHRERSGRAILEKQITGMQEQVKETERINFKVRSMQHDMRNTLAVVMQLAGNAEKSELQDYLKEVNQRFEEVELQFRTGNTVVDTLLNMKYHEAIRELPGLQFGAGDLVFPESLQVQNYDMGVILGNALDNAIEACRKLGRERPEAQPYIRLASFVKGNMFFIEVENRFCGKIIRQKQAEFPLTDKADKAANGMGLRNIKSTAEKYHGAVDWAVKGDVFTLTVMLQNERR